MGYANPGTMPNAAETGPPNEDCTRQGSTNCKFQNISMDLSGDVYVPSIYWHAR